MACRVAPTGNNGNSGAEGTAGTIGSTPPPPPPPPVTPQTTPSPPRPPPPPPPPAPGIAFRDEILPWIDSGANDQGEKKKKKDDEDDGVVDASHLYGDDATTIDTGVTSGSDPTAWDPIGVDRIPDNPGSSGAPGKP